MITFKKFTTDDRQGSAEVQTGKDFSVNENSISLTREQQRAVFERMTDADWARERAFQAEWDREMRLRKLAAERQGYDR